MELSNSLTKRLSTILATMSLVVFMLAAQKHQVGKSISKDLFGIFIEDLNYTADGGLYAEMVQNRSFEYSPSDVDLHEYHKKGQWHPFTAWEFLKVGNAIATLSLETEKPLNANNRHYASVDIFTVGQQGAGLRNNGYNGMVVRIGESYDLSVFLRAKNDGKVCVRLVERDSVLAEDIIDIDTSDWRKYETTLTPNKSSEQAAVEILFLQEGRVDIDMLSLFPQNTFKNRKNGLRADIGSGIGRPQSSFHAFSRRMPHSWRRTE